MINFLLAFLPSMVVVLLVAVVTLVLLWIFVRLFSALLDFFIGTMRAWKVFFILVHIYRNDLRYAAFLKYLDDHQTQIRIELEKTLKEHGNGKCS